MTYRGWWICACVALATACGSVSNGGQKDAAIDGVSHECTPGESRCSADGLNLQVCDSNGSLQSKEACTLSCVPATPTIGAHCAFISPQFAPDICDTDAMMSTATFANVMIDTDVSSSCTGGIIGQVPDSSSATPPDICIMRADSITITGVTTRGSSRVLAFVSDHDLHVSAGAVVDVAAHGQTSGPATISNGTASGGGGFRDPGGMGGTSTGVGGSRRSPPFSVMLGGSSAQSSTNGTGASAFGGGAGGALLLVSCRGKVTIEGTISAGGGGGAAGYAPATGTPVNATGGGSGGYVVIEGAAVSITGKLYANGGGGGGGCCPGSGSVGQDGQLSTLAASGGPSTSDGGGTGGTSVPPGNALGVGGGGGGSAGRFQIFTPMSVSPSVTPAEISPPFDSNLTVPTR